MNLLIYFLLITSCSTLLKDKYPVEWKSPFPSILEDIYLEKEEQLVYKAKLVASSLEFDCTLRNDSPYYWCGIDGTFVEKDPKLPSTLSGLYHSVVNIKGKKVSEKIVSKMIKKKEIISVISTNRAGKYDDYILVKILAFYNSEFCITFFGHDEFCPKTAKITYF